MLCRQLLTVEDVSEVELLAAWHLAGVQVVEVLSVAVVGVPPLAGARLGVAVVPAEDRSLYCCTAYPTVVPLGLVAGGQVQTLLDVGVAVLVVSDGVVVVILPNNVSVGPRELTILLGL